MPVVVIVPPVIGAVVAIDVTDPPLPVADIVNVSVIASVVIVTPEPATTVRSHYMPWKQVPMKIACKWTCLRHRLKQAT